MVGILKKYPCLSPEFVILTNSALVTAYTHLKQYNKAKVYFDKIENLAKPLDRVDISPNFYTILCGDINTS